MSNETINKITILLSSALSLASFSIAFLTGGDLIFIITMRFLLIFALSAVLVWTTLNIVNSVVIKAARESIIELSKTLEEENRQLIREKIEATTDSEEFEEALLKGQNLDFTSEPQEDLSLSLMESEETPEIKVFEPFKPRRIETDKIE